MMKKKYFCSDCKGLKNHKILFEEKQTGEEGYGAFQWLLKFRTIQCLGCDNISFLRIYGDSSMIREGYDGEPEYYEDEDIYPPHLTSGTELRNKHHLPTSIKDIYIETINAFKVGSLLLTAGGFRATIEAVCNHLKIKKSNLEERINLLHNKGYLSLSESKRLHAIRFLGNDALHEMEKPQKEQLDVLLEIINHLLSNLFINDKILQGKIETIIDQYDEFVQLIQNRIHRKMLNTDVSIDQIIGKSKRLITKSNLESFKKRFISQIKDNSITYLQLVDEDTEIFRVLAEPDLSFFWDTL
jgi:hypothetical protein